MKFKQITVVLFGFFLSIIVVSCSTSTIVDRSYDDYEDIDLWKLSNELSELSIVDHIRSDGGHSIQIVNGGCGDLAKEASILLEVVSFDIEDPEDPENTEITPEQQIYEISFSIRRSPTDYVEDTPVEFGENLDEDAPPVLLGENLSVIIDQGGIAEFSADVEIDSDLTWETTTLTFPAQKDIPVTLTFRLGCELDMLWIDSITITNITPEPEVVE